jgi:hypothetical protein
MFGVAATAAGPLFTHGISEALHEAVASVAVWTARNRGMNGKAADSADLVAPLQ